MLKKEAVVRIFADIYQKKIEEINGSLKSTRKCATDAPGSNVSHSDTSKFQYSNLALGIEKRLREAEDILKLLELMCENNVSKSDVVSIGRLVSLQNIDTEEIASYLLIGKEGGGDSAIVDGINVVLIYVKAPLAAVINGKKEGDEVRFMKKKFEILEVQ